MEFILSSVHFKKAAKIKVVVGVFNTVSSIKKKKVFVSSLRLSFDIPRAWCHDP